MLLRNSERLDCFLNIGITYWHARKGITILQFWTTSSQMSKLRLLFVKLSWSLHHYEGMAARKPHMDWFLRNSTMIFGELRLLSPGNGMWSIGRSYKHFVYLDKSCLGTFIWAHKPNRDWFFVEFDNDFRWTPAEIAPMECDQWPFQNVWFCTKC